MKTAILTLAVMGLGLQAFAQDVLYDAKIKKEEVPGVVVEALETDFPEYTVTDYYAVPVEYEEGYSLLNKEINSTDDYDTYNITLIGRDGEMSATYNNNGKLLSSTEHLRNVAPPEAVRLAIAKEFPGWTLEKDAFNMVRYENGRKVEHFRMVLAKGNEKIRVYSTEDGVLLKKSEKVI